MKLTIKNVKRKHAGKYKCKVRYMIGLKESHDYVSLIVLWETSKCETYKIVWKLIIETYTIVLHTTHVINIAVYGNIRLAN